MSPSTSAVPARPVRITLDRIALQGDLAVPDGSSGLVIFAHGSGSSRLSPRNRQVASDFNAAGLATLLLDLLTSDEERVDQLTAELRFDIDLLGGRVGGAVAWARGEPSLSHLPIGLFGASTGAAAALVAAAEHPDVVRAVVSRGGRPDLAGASLGRVRAPTLLLVGGLDDAVIGLNRRAMASMTCQVSLEIIPGATHLFPEPGALELVSGRASQWFVRHLTMG